MNSAEAMCTSPFRVLVQDDMLLTGPLNLSLAATFLEDHPQYLCVRVREAEHVV